MPTLLVLLADGLLATAAVLNVVPARGRRSVTLALAFVAAGVALTLGAPPDLDPLPGLAAAGAAALAVVGSLRLRAEHRTLFQTEERSEALADELRRFAEEASSRIEESQRRFLEVAEVAPMGIFETDRAGRVRWASDRWCRLAGLERSEATGKPWVEAVHAGEREAVRARWAAAAGDGATFEAEFRSRREDVEGWTLCQVTPRAAADGGHLGILHDVTESRRQERDRARLEGRVLQSQKLESLVVLAGGVAHDFNNLLVGILGNTELALDELPRDAPVRELLERVSQAAVSAADLANQMLAYAGEGRASAEVVDLSALVRDVRPLVESAAQAAHVEYELADDLPCVEVDPAQVRQVVLNLVTNAAEATGADGRIRVRTELVQASAGDLASAQVGSDLPAGPYVALAVSDRGPGIDPELVHRVFDPFFTTKFTGRGLGLAVVMGIARRHGAALRILTEPGRGVTMTLLLPPAEGRAAVPVAPARSPRAEIDAGGIVLVADDEERVREVVSTMLERRGFTPLVASGGREAVSLFRAHADELVGVVLDLTMPDQRGDAALAEMRRFRTDVPVVLSSGFTEQGARVDLGADGHVEFLQKPFRVEELMAAFARARAGTTPA